MKKEWVKPEIKKVTDTGAILECLYEVYQMEEESVAQSGKIKGTMVYPFVKMLENQAAGKSAEKIHKDLWRLYLKRGGKDQFIKDANSALKRKGTSIKG